jgi:hypothetical protein
MTGRHTPRFVIAMIVLGLAGAAELPTTRRVTGEYRRAAERAMAAASALAALDEQTLTESTDPDYRAAIADQRAAARRLAEAKKHAAPTHDIEDKLSQLRARRKLFEQVITNANPKRAALVKAAGEARDALRAAKGNDPIGAGIFEKKLVEGMTLAQADEALGIPGELISESAGGMKWYRWAVPASATDAHAAAAKASTATRAAPGTPTGAIRIVGRARFVNNVIVEVMAY